MILYKKNTINTYRGMNYLKKICDINIFKNILKSLSNSSLWCKIILYLIFILLILMIANKYKPKIEGFSQEKNY